MRILIILSITYVILLADVCNFEYSKFPELKKYHIRINGYINEYNTNCDILYAYNTVKNNPSQMDIIENNNTYATKLTEIAKNYPNISQYITDIDIINFFDKYTSYQKTIIDKVMKISFNNKKEINFIYLTLALEFVDSNLKKQNLIKYIKKLKTYNKNEIQTIQMFWKEYNLKYKVYTKRYKKQYIKNFFKIIKIYNVKMLSKYSSYAEDFYPYLIPEYFNNIKYIKTISKLLFLIKGKHINEQAFFLKNVTLDIQAALESGYNPNYIFKYFKYFIANKIVTKLNLENCMQKQGTIILISDYLEYKLKWGNDDKIIYNKILHRLKQVHKPAEFINIIGLYNYSAVLYSQMKNNKQKQIFKYLMNLDLKDIGKNLSLIYTLNEHTNYMSSIINNNDICKNSKYKKIFEQSIEGKNILNMFNNQEYNLFTKNINRLVMLPYNEIDSYTFDEVVAKTVEGIDYATMLIPGGGIALQLGKTIAKTTVKAIVKTTIKNGFKKNSKNIYYKLKNQAKEYWNDKIKYTTNKKNNIMINKSTYTTGNILIIYKLSKKIYDRFFPKLKQKRLCTGVTR